MIVLASLDPGRSWTSYAVITLLFLAALALHVVAHEAAHALTAVAVGMGVPRIRLGEGPLLLKLRLFGTTIEVRGFHSGATFLEPEGVRWLRVRLVLVTAAGPLVNLGLAAAALMLVAPRTGLPELFRIDAVAAGALLGLLNLTPFRGASARGFVHSDGWSLLALLRSPRSAGDLVVAAGKLQTARQRHLDGEQVGPAGDLTPVLESADPLIIGMEGTRRILSRELDDAVALLRRAAELPQDEQQLALTLNNLGWALVLSQPPGWLDEADHASARAVAVLPWMEATMSTRGCVLVHRGAFGEARDLLRRAMAIGVDASRSDRVVQHHHLLRAEHGLGNLFGARASLLAMIDDGAEAQSVDWARRLLRSAEVDNALTNLVDAEGHVGWPEQRETGDQARHLREIRRALADFVDEAGEDPRREAVRTALGADDGQSLRFGA